MHKTLSLNISTSKCPLGCGNCKTVYTNEETGFRIICKCYCHEIQGHNVKRIGDTKECS